MKKIKKVVIALIMCLAIILIFFSNIYAFDISQLTGTPSNNAEMDNLGNKIVTIISTIGSITSVIVLVIIGIKYMLGSVEEKSTYKKTLMPYVIGSILVFAASTIAGWIYSAVK